MTNKNDQITEIAKKLGSRGGKKTFKKHGKKHLSEAGKKGAKARWEKYRKQKELEEQNQTPS